MQTKLQLANAQKTKLKRLLKSAKTTAPNANTKKERQPTHTVSLADILTSLETVALDTHVELLFLQPQKPKTDKTLGAHHVKIKAEGSYQNLLKLINNLFKQPYLVQIKEIGMQNATSNNENLNMSAFLAIHQNTSRPFANSATIKLPKRNIFSKTAPRPNLSLWTTKQLRFLGIIKQNQNTFGIISDPEGTIYQVIVGIKIGKNKITAINETGVYLTDETLIGENR